MLDAPRRAAVPRTCLAWCGSLWTGPSVPRRSSASQIPPASLAGKDGEAVSPSAQAAPALCQHRHRGQRQGAHTQGGHGHRNRENQVRWTHGSWLVLSPRGQLETGRNWPHPSPTEVPEALQEPRAFWGAAVWRPEQGPGRKSQGPAPRGRTNRNRARGAGGARVLPVALLPEKTVPGKAPSGVPRWHFPFPSGWYLGHCCGRTVSHTTPWSPREQGTQEGAFQTRKGAVPTWRSEGPLSASPPAFSALPRSCRGGTQVSHTVGGAPCLMTPSGSPCVTSKVTETKAPPPPGWEVRSRRKRSAERSLALSTTPHLFTIGCSSVISGTSISCR